MPWIASTRQCEGAEVVLRMPCLINSYLDTRQNTCDVLHGISEGEKDPTSILRAYAYPRCVGRYGLAAAHQEETAPPMLSVSISASVSVDAAACLARSPWQPSRLKLANGRDELENT